MAQVSFGGADIFRLLYFIKSKAPFGNPAFGGFRYQFFPFSSELRFRFFRTLPALYPPYISLNLHLAKYYHSLNPAADALSHSEKPYLHGYTYIYRLSTLCNMSSSLRFL